LTSIALSPGNEHDGHHAGTLVDQQPEQRRPARVVGDTALRTSARRRSGALAGGVVGQRQSRRRE